jgi:hypothetical protein
MRKHLSIYFMLLSFIIGGCAGSKPSKPAAEPQAPKGQNANILNEDFDPLTLKEPELQIPPKAKPTQTETQAVVNTPAADTSIVQVVGYQVQILQTEDAALARAVVRDAAVMLATAVDFIFDSPYFKVRAGNFVNRYDAEQLQELALSKGYASAWVVRTMVRVRASELERQ